MFHTRSEAERARYRMLGCDEVGGHRNVASDKDFMDKNKALRKSDQQKSGKRVFSSFSPRYQVFCFLL